MSAEVRKDTRPDMPVYNAILEKYDTGISIKSIARELSISEVKVRRVLITEGVWSSTTSEEIRELYQQGLNAAQIAEKLMKPLKTVQAYMPYTRGEYNDGEMSDNARWSRDFRKRKQNAMERQQGAMERQQGAMERQQGAMERQQGAMERQQGAMERQQGVRGEAHIVETDDRMRGNVMKMVDIDKWKKEAGYSGDGRKVLKLHLELQMDLDEEEEAVLRKYGKSEKGISRDFLVSEDMLLHNLHYAIQRAFGWQNSHLHRFEYPDNVFKKMTERGLAQWISLCGLYFRYPGADNEDIYWDDDYEDDVSIKTWLKWKYSAPYVYCGWSEHYMCAQTEARTFWQQNPVLRIGPSFEEYMAGNKDSKVKKIEDVTVGEMDAYFEFTMAELLERLPIGQVIGLKETEDWESKVAEIADKAGDAFAGNYAKIMKLVRQQKDFEIDILHEETDPNVVPVSDSIVYSYDYGDGWTVEITCDEIYESFDSWNRGLTMGYAPADMTEEEVFNDQHPVDSKGHLIDGELRDQIATVIAKEKPVCIAADGLPVMDDVGGPGGYCGFLNGIHGQNSGPYPYEEKQETREWGRNMGWTGKMNKPGNIL